MQKLLIISGPTASGKTSLALKLAEKFNGELLSADSRQLYKFMDIVTGKDIPIGFSKKGEYYTNGNIRIWGYSLLTPDKQANASWYAHYAREVINNIWARGKLPILVGGTGFYINALLGKYPYLDFPNNEKLRKKLDAFSTPQLYEHLFNLEPDRANNLNNSDKNNKRRLVRAIEVSQLSSKKFKPNLKRLQADILWIGLKLPISELKERINQRVDSRLGSALDAELATLKSKGFLSEAPANTIGYQQLIKFLQGESSFKIAVEDWKKAEYKYAKRQMTWFNKESNIFWVSPTNSNLVKMLSVKVRKWYSKGT